ncbi:uncharacterized protein LOC120977697 [Bufo bufo]|uniref:uncharacterized protein LOC120977697 n=1 Tax=Bufo bufo TaxID=8384 RepID=UPI001ABE05A6|nr:uncharacterized protein LOC120977697 [Bufo bufo]
MTAAEKMKTPILLSPSLYKRRSGLQAAARRTPPSRHSAPVSGARNAKTPSKSPSAGCTSAPTGSTRSPAGGTPARNPSSISKRGETIGAIRERHSVPVMQKEPQMKYTAPYLLVPVRLKRAGLKPLDPEKVKNLTSASRVPVSGDVKQNIILRQTALHRQPPWSRKQHPLPRSSVKQTESSRRRTEIASRRENTNQPGAVKALPSDEHTGGHQLSHQMNQLNLDDKGCDESRTSDNGQVSNDPAQTAQPEEDLRDASSLAESNVQDIQKSSPLSNVPEMSEETEGNLIKQDVGMLVIDSSYPMTGDGQDQAPGDEKALSQPPLCHVVENQTEDPPTGKPQPRCRDINMVDGSYKPSEVEPTTEGQEKCRSNHSHLKDTGPNEDLSHPVSPRDQKDSLTNFGGTESNSAEDDLKTPDLPPHEHNATVVGSQRVRLRTNDILKQSQGVLVLTRSTDENAIFIPKLKFGFTPDNSIDWTMPVPPPMDSNRGGPTKKNDPRILSACTPRGPTFSKSVLKKSFMLPGQDLPCGSSEPALRLARARDVTSCPLDRIVDLSISFQGKFEEQEIPADIPKILLTEEDNDED